MIYIGHNGETGEPYGSTKAASAEEAVGCFRASPNAAVIQHSGETLPDLTDKWIDGGKLVDRASVKDQNALDAIAAAEAEKTKALTRAELADTDLPFVRVLEDLTASLISKGVIEDSDLPQAAQDKLQARADLRAALDA